MSNKKKETFRRLAEGRTKKAIDSMNLLTNLSNTSHYEYEENEVKKIIDALKEGVRLVESSFQKPLSKRRGFKLWGQIIKKILTID